MTEQILTQEAPPNSAPPTDWRASLPEDIRSDASLQVFKDLPSFAKSHLELRKSMGDAIRLPKSDASPEEWNKLYDRLGRPESADKYELKRPTLAEGAAYDEEAEKSFKTWAHETGLHPRQAQAIFDKYNAYQTSKLDAFTKQMSDGVGELKKEWGGDFDKRIGLAQRAVKEVAGKEVLDLLKATGLGDHPTFIKFFSQLGEDRLEAPLEKGNSAVSESDAATIQSKIDAIRNDPQHPYQNSKATPQSHDAAVKEMNKLYEQLSLAKGESTEENN